MIKTKLPSLSKPLFCCCFMLLALCSCNNSGEKIPDVSNIKISLQTSRFDIDFSAIDTNHIGQGLQQLYAKYPGFLNYYLDTFMACGINRNYSDTARNIKDSLKPYLVLKDFVNLENTVREHYPNTKDIDQLLSDGFRYMKYYFPGYFVTNILYINTYLAGNWPTFPLDSTTLCVGIDWFLGDQFPHYASVGALPYMVAHRRKSYIPVSVFNVVYKTIHPFNTNDKTLLDLMIQRGKEQYFLHKILPHTPDSVLFGFPQRKLNWCAENEGLIYNFFIHQGLLYNKEPQNIMPYINDGPFAVNMPVPDPANNTPGNIGTWLGYKIVCAYMAQNPAMTLQQLSDQLPDAPRFLDAARYRPK